MAIFIDLATLSPTQGATLIGQAPGDYFGVSVAGAGDINGDGTKDMVIGAFSNDEGGEVAGAAYVIYGGQALDGLSMASLTTSQGFKITGKDAGDSLGYSVAGIGDINGDGVDDVLVGAPSAPGSDTQAGEAYVLFGSASGLADINLDLLTPSMGFEIHGALYDDRAGISLAAAGDVNGDGLDDMMVGAWLGEEGGNNSGQAYVIFGRDVDGGDPAFGTVDLAALPTSTGITIFGDWAQDQAGRSIAPLGDVNGDGIDDVIMGAEQGDNTGPNAGEAYVIFGRDTDGGDPALTNVDLSSLLPANGFVIEAADDYDFLGYSVAGAGDLNNDGINDIAVGAIYGDGGGDSSGEIYVIYGRDVAGGADAFGTIDLATLAPSDGFQINGGASDDYAAQVAGAGDLNGDGVDDLLIGAEGADGTLTYQGAAYVIYGRDLAGGAEAFTTLDLGNIADTDGLTILGETGLGGALGVGDVNGDGTNDILLGNDNNNNNASGLAYVLYGGATLLAAPPIKAKGTKANDKMTGDTGGDKLDGRAGNDTLKGLDGDDKLIGNTGNDKLFGGLGQDILSGGTGKDQFIFTDVADSPAGAPDRITDFDKKDKIVLKAIDAIPDATGNHAFLWAGTDAFSGLAGELRYEKTAKRAASVQADLDGDTLADFEIEVALVGLTKLNAADFIL